MRVTFIMIINLKHQQFVHMLTVACGVFHQICLVCHITHLSVYRVNIWNHPLRILMLLSSDCNFCTKFVMLNNILWPYYQTWTSDVNICRKCISVPPHTVFTQNVLSVVEWDSRMSSGTWNSTDYTHSLTLTFNHDMW